MSGNDLTLRTPEDRVIVPYVCDHAAISSFGFQLTVTGEETLELHKFVSGILAGDIEVQDGVSIRALGDMSATLGGGLKPLGDYFTTLGDATWKYAEACRIAGDLTKFMPERQENLRGALAALVAEEENTAAWEQLANGLADDETMSDGYLIRYSVLNEEGILNHSPDALLLTGKKRQDALRFIGSHRESLETLKGSVHSRNEELLTGFDAAVNDWEGEANTFVDAMDGILGPLKDTREENLYQQDGSVADVAGNVATTAGVVVLIPFPPSQAIAAVIGLLAVAVGTAGQGSQVQRAAEGEQRGIRTVDGQVVGEVVQTGESALGFAAFFKALKLLGAGKGVKPGTPDGSIEDMPEQDVREPGPAVDVGVSTDPIARWQEEADATNPEHEYTPNNPYETESHKPNSIPDTPASETGSANAEPTGIEVETDG